MGQNGVIGGEGLWQRQYQDTSPINNNFTPQKSLSSGDWFLLKTTNEISRSQNGRIALVVAMVVVLEAITWTSFMVFKRYERASTLDMFASRQLAVLQMARDGIETAQNETGPLGMAILQRAMLRQVRSGNYETQAKAVREHPRTSRYFTGAGNMIVYSNRRPQAVAGELKGLFTPVDENTGYASVKDKNLEKELDSIYTRLLKFKKNSNAFDTREITVRDKKYLISSAMYSSMSGKPAAFFYASVEKILDIREYNTRIHALSLTVFAISLTILGFAIFIISGILRESHSHKIARQSVARLEEEVAERKKIETELNRYRVDLELLVEERTGELIKTREDLTAAERLAVIGKFAGNISHEIRNPLAAISSSVYLIKMRLGQDIDSETDAHIKGINDQIKQCSDIIDGILRLSRMEAAVLLPVSAFELIDHAVASSHIPDNVNMKFDYPAEDIEILADFEQIRIALKNILTNAAQAMGGSGTISIKLSRNESGASAILTISDTGPGIPQDSIDKIFQPLYSTKAFGMGFGLAIANTIVERHNGAITVASEPGAGAVFTIKLPSKQPSAQKPAEQA